MWLANLFAMLPLSNIQQSASRWEWWRIFFWRWSHYCLLRFPSLQCIAWLKPNRRSAADSLLFYEWKIVDADVFGDCWLSQRDNNAYEFLLKGAGSTQSQNSMSIYQVIFSLPKSFWGGTMQCFTKVEGDIWSTRLGWLMLSAHPEKVSLTLCNMNLQL